MKIRYFERGLSKSLKNVIYFFFQSHSYLMDKIIKKQKELGTKYQSLSGFEASSEKFHY